MGDAVRAIAFGGNTTMGVASGWHSVGLFMRFCGKRGLPI